MRRTPRATAAETRTTSRARRAKSGIGALDTINYKTADYVNHFLFEMLGAPEIAGKAREELNALADEIDDWIGPLLNPLRWAADEVKDVIATLLKKTIKEATGLDVDEIRRFITKPERWMCGGGVRSITLPGGRHVRPLKSLQGSRGASAHRPAPRPAGQPPSAIFHDVELAAGGLPGDSRRTGPSRSTASPR